MEYQPYNRSFWLTLVVVVFSGGLLLGGAYALNDRLDAQGAEMAVGSAAALQHIELRHINVEVQQLLQETLEDDFSEIDELLDEL